MKEKTSSMLGLPLVWLRRGAAEQSAARQVEFASPSCSGDSSCGGRTRTDENATDRLDATDSTPHFKQIDTDKATVCSFVPFVPLHSDMYAK